MKVALIGAGAVGAYFIWGFEDCDDIELTVIARNSRFERLKAQGVQINGKVYKPAVMTPEEAGEQDLILVATKYDALDEVIGYLEPMIGKDSLVLSLLNGVDSESRIARKIGWEHVSYSVMRIASKNTKSGITFDPDYTMGVYVGRDQIPDNIMKVLEKTKIKMNLKEDIIKDMWIKYASNIANNLPQAVLYTDASLYIDSEHGYYIASRLWEEAYKVAKAKDIDIGKEPVIFIQVPKTSKYSTLQDLEAGRHTEIDMFAGQLIKMAKEEHIDVPFTEYTFHAIKALEEKNDGKINKA